MIFINNSPDVPKKFSSFTKALADNYDSISNIMYWLLGEGVVNFGDTDVLDPKNDFRLSFYYNAALNKYLMKFKYVNTQKDLKMTFVESDISKAYLSSLKGSSFYSQTIVFDDNNLLAGSIDNKLELPLRNLVSDDVAGYSSEYFSAMYVNGYPQKTSNMNIEADEKNNILKIGFKSIYGGAVFPDPVNKYNLFTDMSINGGSGKDWIDYFAIEKTDSIELYLKFSNSNIYKTPRYLIARIIDSVTQNVKNFHIPKNLASSDGLFYSIDPRDEETIIVSISKDSEIYLQFFYSESNNNQNNIQFMFLNALTNLSPFSVSFSGLSRKYKLPNSNLIAPDALNELKVLTYDSSTNTVSDISLLNTSLLGSLFSLDYNQGILEILNVLTGQITSTTVVLAYNIKYSSPLQIDYTGDFSSNVTIYGTHGSTYVAENVVDSATNALNLPSTLYVWAYLKESPKKYFPIIDETGKLSSINQYTELDINFFITETNEYTDILSTTNLTYSNTKPINIGFLNLSKPTPSSNDPETAYYSFALNSQLMAPYAKYKQLLTDSSVYLLDYKAFNVKDISKTKVPVRTIGTGDLAVKMAKKYYTVGFVPSNTEVIELYGYLGKNRTTYDDTGDVFLFNEYFNNTQYYYNAKLRILDASLLYQFEKSTKLDPTQNIDYEGLSIDVFDLIDPNTSNTDISKEYIELVSNDTSQSTVFAPRVLDTNYLNLINNKVLVLEVSVPVQSSDSIQNLLFDIDFDLYIKYIPKVVNYINTL